MILKLCKGVHCVDLDESFPTHMCLQNFVSIQPRTSPLKFARSSRAAGCATESPKRFVSIVSAMSGRRDAMMMMTEMGARAKPISAWEAVRDFVPRKFKDPRSLEGSVLAVPIFARKYSVESC